MYLDFHTDVLPPRIFPISRTSNCLKNKFEPDLPDFENGNCLDLPWNSLILYSPHFGWAVEVCSMLKIGRRNWAMSMHVLMCDGNVQMCMHVFDVEIQVCCVLLIQIVHHISSSAIKISVGLGFFKWNCHLVNGWALLPVNLVQIFEKISRHRGAKP